MLLNENLVSNAATLTPLRPFVEIIFRKFVINKDLFIGII